MCIFHPASSFILHRNKSDSIVGKKWDFYPIVGQFCVSKHHCGAIASTHQPFIQPHRNKPTHSLYIHWINENDTRGAPYLQNLAHLIYGQTFSNFFIIAHRIKKLHMEHVPNNILNQVVVFIIFTKEPNSSQKALFRRCPKMLLTHIRLLRNLFLDMRS